MSDRPSEEQVDKAYFMLYGFARIDEILKIEARGLRIPPFNLRVILALAVKEGDSYHDDLARQIKAHASAVRRASTVLRMVGLVTVTDKEGERPKPGVRASVALSADGWEVGNRMIEAITFDPPKGLG